MGPWWGAGVPSLGGEPLVTRVRLSIRYLTPYDTVNTANRLWRLAGCGFWDRISQTQTRSHRAVLRGGDWKI